MTEPPGEPASSDLPIVDAHHHLWDRGHLFYPWLDDSPRHSFFLGDQSPLPARFLPRDYRRGSAGHDIVATVHVEAEVDRSLQVAETDWLSALSRAEGMPDAIVAHAWFDTPNAAEILEAQAARPLVRGIRSKPVTAATPTQSVAGARRSMQDRKWIEGYRRLEALGLSYDLRVPFWHLQEAARLAGEHPGIPVALNHAGFPWDRSAEGLAIWRRGMRLLAHEQHVYCKLSCVCVPGLPWSYAAHRDVVREAIDIFGVQRCMFATNVPPDTLQVSLDEMLTAYKAMVADLSRTEQQALLHDNATRFYRLRPR